jgi:hypothetical protein
LCIEEKRLLIISEKTGPKLARTVQLSTLSIFNNLAHHVGMTPLTDPQFLTTDLDCRLVKFRNCAHFSGLLR